MCLHSFINALHPENLWTARNSLCSDSPLKRFKTLSANTLITILQNGKERQEEVKLITLINKLAVKLPEAYIAKRRHRSLIVAVLTNQTIVIHFLRKISGYSFMFGSLTQIFLFF